MVSYTILVMEELPRALHRGVRSGGGLERVDLEKDVLLAQKGDREAFSRLILSLEANLYRVARSMVKRDEDCADALQETIFKAYQSVGNLREPAYFKSWIFRILINECNQILRSRKRTVVSGTLPNEQVMPGGYDKVELREAVDRLEESLHIVITLYYYEDLPIRQISQVLDISEGTIKSRLSRARSVLADWLTVSEGRKLPL